LIDPTDDEIHFIRRLAQRQGEVSLYGDFKLSNIDRLIPEYVTHVSASMDTGRFALTEKGWQLAQLIEHRPQPSDDVQQFLEGQASAKDLLPSSRYRF
jgi:hypothetical protein